ncbi:glycoside hydrolase family 16 protein [Auriscalpium vulgare]|uniref:Glycoside hydrolase family 16 protein n=1 Tax=Auriscalpium vulgare TaxID=40419 RepID=A0ACB8RDC2_9AGAM|nr:glycoside hydrolase family 16 protein [Auriscalpium vulgare]
MLTVAFTLSSLVLATLAGSEGSLRSRHHEHARSVQARAKTYNLEDMYKGKDFLNEQKWSYFTAPDPTGGQVNFLSHSDAVSEGLAYVQDDGVTVLAVDNKNDLPLGNNRNSVRISSTKTYSSGLFIADFWAMAHGCSVWPAWWSVGPNWPNGGEIDIIEGVNNKPTNQYTLHSGAGSSCTLTNNPPTSGVDAFTGNVIGTTCQSADGANAGCGVLDTDTRSFGHGFNVQGGGVFAHLWDSNGVKMWRFSRGEIPADIEAGKPDPTSWPTPVAFWSSDNCDIAEHFHDHQLVIDTTLCGGFAGGDYPNSGCPGTCQEAVANKTNFDFAQWKINYIAVYN